MKSLLEILGYFPVTGSQLDNEQIGIARSEIPENMGSPEMLLII
jgi:hypothetical protein